MLVSLASNELTPLATPEMEPDKPDTLPLTEPDEPVIAVRISQFDGLQVVTGAAMHEQYAISIGTGAGNAVGVVVNAVLPISWFPAAAGKNVLPTKSRPPI